MEFVDDVSTAPLKRIPVGMQIIGRPFDEGTLFRLGHAYQGATSWHTRTPRL